MFNVADMDGTGTVPFTENGTANLFGASKSADAGFRIVMDGDLEDCMSVCTPSGEIFKFVRSTDGLHFHDTHKKEVMM